MDASEVAARVADTRDALANEHVRQQVVQRIELAAELRSEHEYGGAPVEARQAADQLDREAGRILQANPNVRWDASTSVSLLQPDQPSSRELRARFGLTEQEPGAQPARHDVDRTTISDKALDPERQQLEADTVYVLEPSESLREAAAKWLEAETAKLNEVVEDRGQQEYAHRAPEIVPEQTQDRGYAL